MNFTSFFSIVSVLFGCALEYYAYMLFNIIMPIFVSSFFGPAEALTALTYGYLIIFLGALFRPLGGLILGYIGDKKGRNVALFWAMILMAASSIFIAYLPTYAQIGSWAAFFLLLCRMAQTMSAAGELNGSAIFLIETLDKPNKRSTKGLASGLAWCFTVLGMFAASVASYHSSQDNWRWAFMLGGIIGLFALILRFLPKVAHGHQVSAKISKDFNFVRSVTASILIAAGISGMFYYNMIFMPGKLQYTLEPFMVRKYSMYYFLVYAFMLLFGGMITDYLKKKYRLMLFACIGIAILAIPTLYMQNLNFNFINVILLAFYVGPSHAILFHLFPREFRYRGVSTAYSIGTSIAGGITPWICAYFGKQYQYFPSYWVMLMALLGFVGIMLSRKTIASLQD